jgi:hypothetical protein
MKDKWLSFILVLLFGNFGALYTWKTDWAFLVISMCIGACFGVLDMLPLASAFGIMIQFFYLVTIITIPKEFYKNYEYK